MAVPRLPNFADLTALARLFEFRTVSRWVGLGLLVGVLSGLAACGFFLLMDLAKSLLLGDLAGFHAREPAGEPSLFGEAQGPVVPWVLVLLPALGGLVSGLLVHTLARGSMQGTNAMVHDFHNARGKVNLRFAVVRATASALMAGSGGSVGREGPMAYLCAGIGSWLGNALRLTVRERRLLLIAGAAGGMGAIFRTPLGAALFAVECLYRDDFEVEGLVPTVLSSVVAYSIFTLIFGQGAMFAVGEYPFDPRQLPFYLLMACGAALIGVVHLRAMHFAKTRFAQLPLPRWLTPALGGLGVGLLALVLPQAIGPGYGWLQVALQPEPGQLPAGWLGAGALLGFALLKILTTALSVGSGGSGGEFGPTVVVGGLVGGAFGLAFHQLLPGVVTHPGAFIIVGMACFVGGATHAPVSTLVMASEMTGSYDLLVPVMLAEVVTFALMRRFSLLEAQVPARRDSPAHAGEYVLDVLQEMRVSQVYDPLREVTVATPETSLEGLLRRASQCSKQTVFPVVDDQGRVSGVVTLDLLREYFFDEDVAQFAIAQDFAQPYVSVAPSDTLNTALERFASSQYPELPVSSPDEPDRILGILGYDDVLDAYKRELLRRQLGEEPVSRVDSSLV